MVCDKTATEARQTISICYALQESVHAGAEEKLKLLELAQMANNNYPFLTAAGFFVVDRGVLLKILSITTTYFIVILQFHPKPS